MARYAETIDTTVSGETAFAYLAELENFAKWDPGVRSSVRVAGDAPSLGAAYDVTVNGLGRPMVLRYHIVTFDPPNRLVIDARTRTLRSVDTITVRARDGGATVTYEATLQFRGVLRFASFALARGFKGIASRAGAGLREAFARMERA